MRTKISSRIGILAPKASNTPTKIKGTILLGQTKCRPKNGTSWFHHASPTNVQTVKMFTEKRQEKGEESNR